MYQCGSKSMPSLLEFDANFEPQIGRVLIFFLLAHLRGLQDYFVSWLSRSSADQTSCQAQLTKRNSPLKIFRLGRVAVAGLIGSYESWIEHINLRSLRHYFEFEFSNNSYFAEVVLGLGTVSWSWIGSGYTLHPDLICSPTLDIVLHISSQCIVLWQHISKTVIKDKRITEDLFTAQQRNLRYQLLKRPFPFLWRTEVLA